MNEAQADQLLQDGEWERLWQGLGTLPLFKSSQLLGILRSSGWQPDDSAERNRLRQAIAAAEHVRQAYASRQGLLIPDQTWWHADEWLRCISISPDGCYVATTCRVKDSFVRHQITVRNLKGEIVGQKVSDVILSETCISPDGKMLAGADSPHGSTVCWSLPQCDLVQALPRFNQPLFSRDGQQLFLATSVYPTYTGHSSGPPPGRTDVRHLIRAYDLGTWYHCEYEQNCHPGYVWTMALSPFDQLLAVGAGLGVNAITIYDVLTGKTVRVLEEHQDSVRHVLFSPDGRYLASASYDGTVKLWQTSLWAVVGSTPPPPPQRTRPHFSVAFSPDSQLLAAADLHSGLGREPFAIALLEVPNLHCVRRLSGCASKPDHFVFTPSGNAFIAGATEGIGFTCVWSTHDGSLLHTFEDSYSGHLTPDGRTLLVRTVDRSGNSAVQVVSADIIDLVLSSLSSVSDTTIQKVRSLGSRRFDAALERSLLELASAIASPTRNLAD